MFAESPRGTVEQVLHHEIMHLIGTRHYKGDRYENGKAHVGWEGNIAADPSGDVDERNIEDIVTRSRPHLSPAASSGTGPAAQSSTSNVGPQGCMAPGGNCWN